MFNVIVKSGFNPTTSYNDTETWYTYGPFKSWAAASRWACANLQHVADNYWFIGQFIEVEKNG